MHVLINGQATNTGIMGSNRRVVSKRTHPQRCSLMENDDGKSNSDFVFFVRNIFNVYNYISSGTLPTALPFSATKHLYLQLADPLTMSSALRQVRTYYIYITQCLTHSRRILSGCYIQLYLLRTTTHATKSSSYGIVVFYLYFRLSSMNHGSLQLVGCHSGDGTNANGYKDFLVQLNRMSKLRLESECFN